MNMKDYIEERKKEENRRKDKRRIDKINEKRKQLTTITT
jgi:hypothetical protein